MSLTLKETQTLAEISEFLYSFLPGQPHPFADQGISFAGIARELSLGKFWQGGSKQPAINALLENTLDLTREKFCPLILEIVRRGIKYRGGKGSPITREDIQTLNELILEVGFKTTFTRSYLRHLGHKARRWFDNPFCSITSRMLSSIGVVRK